MKKKVASWGEAKNISLRRDLRFIGLRVQLNNTGTGLQVLASIMWTALVRDFYIIALLMLSSIENNGKNVRTDMRNLKAACERIIKNFISGRN